MYTFVRPTTIREDTGWYACAEEGVEIENHEQIIDHKSNDIAWIYVYVNCKNNVMPRSCDVVDMFFFF